ncbi:MAG: zf-HC2 domain-containing protein [Planctomycetes bacterium]|nr:zf-HC2 domain-containing protein [Planctomycetota bacterium]
MSDPRPIPCDEVDPLLPLIADGTLDESKEPAVFNHLAGCARCQDQLVRHDLVTLALEPAAGTPRRRPAQVVRLPLPWAAAAAASIAALVAAGWALQADRRAAVTVAAATPASDTEILTVPGQRPGEEVYIIRRNGPDGQTVLVVDPRQGAARAADGTDVPVGLRRY